MENLTSESFKEKIFDYTENQEWLFKGTRPAIIDFYADWCSPCKAVAPVLEQLSTEHTDIDFYKVDTETELELAQTFQIRSIPSILFIPVNDKPQMAMGALPKETFVNIIDDVFKIK